MKSIINANVLGIKSVFSAGNSGCKHQWVYDKPTSMAFTTPAKIIQERICDCCGRNEQVIIEVHQAKYEMDKFVALKERFSQQ